MYCCFVCIHVVTVLDLELQTVVSIHVGTGN